LSGLLKSLSGFDRTRPSTFDRTQNSAFESYTRAQNRNFLVGVLRPKFASLEFRLNPAPRLPMQILECAVSSEHILVVEDDPLIRSLLEAQLQAEGYEVVSVPDSSEAIAAIQTRKPDLMILDLTLIDGSPGNSLGSGFALLHYMRRTFPAIDFPVIVHTADVSPSVDTQAQAIFVSAVCHKGDDPKLLLVAVRKALDDWKAREAA
jgi:CheY-like chemotaxis protein